MSVIATLAQLFQRSAVPSVESTIIQLENRPAHLPVLSQGEIRERAIANLRSLLGEGTTVSNQTIGTALARIQTALQRGSAIERGEQVPRQLIPVDPTIPIGTEFRYRVLVEISKPSPIPGMPGDFITKIIPVDSETELTRQQIIDRTLPAIQTLGATGGFHAAGILAEGMQQPGATLERISIVSAYRSPIG